MREKPKNENQTKIIQNGKTDFSFWGKTKTERGKDANNEPTTKKDNEQETPKAFKHTQTAEISDETVGDDDIFVPTSESPPKSNCCALDIISDVSANTFKARVEYAKSLGIDDGIARRLCNFAQSNKFPLFKMHYESFVGKSEKEVGEAFACLNLIVQKTKKTNGLRRIATG
ncbi:MAG: hypothetical protein LE168_05795 [Endomicrobium sp.]|nr:hypothetical protein [Endomicrobium sp.]